jgi:probable phosphoglycerate mutase
MRLYIIRHGDPDYITDTLTPQGKLEAEALAEHLKNEGFTHIYYSPLGRARETMTYTSKFYDLEPQVEEWTQELSHWVELDAWGKMHVCDVPGEVVRQLEEGATHEGWMQRSFYNDPVLMDKVKYIQHQSDLFLARHGYERCGELFNCVTPNSDKIAVFCHAALGMTWLSYLLGIPTSLMWTGFWPAPTSVTTVLFEQRSSAWAVPRCIGFGDVSHLNMKGIPVSPRGIMANFY